ncbi:hypothetical protein OFN13_29130, partial [Escherichia coli]|nr:hypothetical protein [Escherichia coli]
TIATILKENDITSAITKLVYCFCWNAPITKVRLSNAIHTIATTYEHILKVANMNVIINRNPIKNCIYESFGFKYI